MPCNLLRGGIPIVFLEIVIPYRPVEMLCLKHERQMAWEGT
jgi:hypothetical protein